MLLYLLPEVGVAVVWWVHSVVRRVGNSYSTMGIETPGAEVYFQIFIGNKILITDGVRYETYGGFGSTTHTLVPSRSRVQAAIKKWVAQQGL